MAQEQKELVVLMTHGADHELSSVGFTIACGGLTAGMKVCAFLTSAAVDLVRRGGTDLTHVAPLDPLMQLMTDFMARGEIVGLDADTALAAALYSAKHQLPMADSIILVTARNYQATLWTQDADLKGHKGVKYKARPD